MSGVKWICGCGLEGRGETGAQRHVKECGFMGWPNVELSEEERYWSKVIKRGPDECWGWRGGLDAGYPIFNLKGGTKERGHRYALRLKLGRPLVDGAVACHRCHNPSCVNPAHIYEGTDKSNSDDKVRAQRHAHGARNGSTHLTDADVLEIVRRYEAGGVTQRHLADQYGVHQSEISRMTRRESWTHLWERSDVPA